MFIMNHGYSHALLIQFDRSNMMGGLCKECVDNKSRSEMQTSDGSRIHIPESGICLQSNNLQDMSGIDHTHKKLTIQRYIEMM